MERRMLGDHIGNQSILQRSRVKDIAVATRTSKIRREEYVVHIADIRWTSRIVECYLREGKRALGRHKRWRVHVEKMTGGARDSLARRLESQLHVLGLLTFNIRPSTATPGPSIYRSHFAIIV